MSIRDEFLKGVKCKFLKFNLSISISEVSLISYVIMNMSMRIIDCYE